MTSGAFGPGYRSIDDADQPDALLSYLDGAAEVPAIAAAKRRLTEALRAAPGQRVLDVGCGTGVDLPGMAEAVRPGGRVVGIDVSERAVGEAGRRLAGLAEVEVLVADAHALPFADAGFDAIRVDRTMLHVTEPERALGEFRRVLVAGGRLAILETGCRLTGSAAVLEDPVRRAVAERFWSDAQSTAQINLFLPLLLARSGFGDVQVERSSATSADFADADRLMRLQAGAQEAAEAGAIAPADARRWLDAVRAAMASGEVALAWEGVHFAAVKAG
jgi:ubiquinone/menaquinone biosynthesis C-methylase UbiE